MPRVQPDGQVMDWFWLVVVVLLHVAGGWFGWSVVGPLIVRGTVQDMPDTEAMFQQAKRAAIAKAEGGE